jgi:hypothetical protein
MLAGQLSGENRYGIQAGGITKKATDAGFFDPTGSPLLRAALRRRAMRTAQNRRQAGAGAAQLAGLDPMSARQSFVDTNRGVNADTANDINESEFQFLQGGQDFARNLFSDRLRSEDETKRLKLEAKMQKDAENRQSRRGFLSDNFGLAGQYLSGGL